MPLPNIHNVEIDPGNANMLRWGDLVWDWIRNAKPRPNGSVANFNQVLQTEGVIGTAYDRGIPNRQVEIREYNGLGNIIIPIPSENMVRRDWAYMEAQWDAGMRAYPLPPFYSLLFSGNPQNVTKPQLVQFGKRRVGEYVINECM